MLQTILVYSLLFFVMYVLCYYASKQNKWWAVVVALIIYSIIFGLRYGVGVDFFGYLEIYEKCRITDGQTLLYGKTFAPGFLFIMKTLALNNFHYGWFFGVVAFLQIFLVFLSVKKDRYIYPFLVITFMLGGSWLSYANGLRQILAVCCFMVSLRFAGEKKIIWHYIFICLAILMHNSAWILIIFYPLLWFKGEWFSNLKLQFILLGISLVIMQFDAIWGIMQYIDYGAELLGYERYLDVTEKLQSKELGIGLGFFIMLMINIICIYFSNDVKHFFNSRFLVYIYNFYFIGVLIAYAFLTSHIIQRVNYYFYGLQLIFAAYTLFYLSKENKKFFYLLLSLYFLTFVAILYRAEFNTAMYLFNWEVSYKGFIG